MNVTEQDARTMICPHLLPDTAANDDIGPFGPCTRVRVHSHPLCAGSACMAWRWGEPLMETRPFTTAADRPDADPNWRLAPKPDNTGQQWQRVKAKRGYCGLAGVPGGQS